MADHDSGARGPIPDNSPVDDPVLSARYRQGAVEMPSRHLDEAVLSASRKSVAPRKHMAFSPFASDWHVPVSLAAVLVMSVVLVVTMRREPVLPALEAPILQSPSLTAMQKGQTLKKPAISAQGAAETAAPQPVAPSGEIAAMQRHDEALGVVSSPETGPAAQPPSQREDTAREFNRMFVGDEIQGGVPAAGPAVADAAASFAPAPAIAGEKRRSSAMLKQEPLAVPHANQDDIKSKSAGSVERVVSSADQSLPDRQFITRLIGNWSGTAVTTPIGPVAYDIRFRSVAGDCISGTAHPGTNHTWTFCIRDGALSLDFLTDFRGNRMPIQFRKQAYKDGVYTLKADTHDFMEVLVFADESTAWMKIFHYGKLHVEIQLKHK